MEIIEIEFEELNKFLNISITECGDENLYFECQGKRYFCKCL